MSSEMTDEDEYDLDAVEAQLARMQLQRQQRSGNRPSQPPQPQQCCPVDHHHIRTSEFELNEANLSHGSESEESDCDSISTNSLSSDDDDTSGTRRLTVAKKPTATRLRDSLDLSMSVAELPKPHKAMVNNRWSKQPVHSAMCKPELVQEQHCNDAKKSRSSDAPGAILEVKTHSGSRERADDNEDDVWTSSLVRRRRQLEKEAALEKDQFLHINTTATAAAAAQPHQNGVEPRFRSTKARDTLPSSSNTATPSSQLVQTTAAGNISNQRVADFGSCNEPPLSKNLNATPPAQLVKQEPRPEQVELPLVAQTTQLPSKKISVAVKKAPLVKKPSQSLSSVAPSSLKPPERYITRAPVTAAHAASASGTARAQHPAATGLEHGAKSKGSTGTPARAPEMPVEAQTHIVSKASNKAQSNAHHHVHFAPEDDDDDDDLLSVEEEKLRQSLEKLDSRLTKLSNGTRQQHKSSKVSSQDGRTVTAISGLHSSSSKTQSRPLLTTNRRHERDGDRTPPVADFADDDVVAAGVYGGGAHCKSGQVTSALERSCYTRRAEMSSGLHKLRVRTGGATAQESNNSSANLDKDGKHKVVVKKDLAHLLF